MNINKIVPRCSINAKLAIAFALLTFVPLVVVAAIATSGAVRHLRAAAEATVEYDLEVAQLRVQRSIQEAEQRLEFLADAFLRQAFDETSNMDFVREVTTILLRSDSSAIFRVKVIDLEGRLVFQASRDSESLEEVERGARGGLLYVWAAETSPGPGNLLLPVELTDRGASGDSLRMIPAVAIVRPLRDAAGLFLGVAVAEASAAVFFDGLELASSGLTGTTGLVDRAGFFLYHSERKRDWASLLAGKAEINLGSDFSPSVTESILSGSQSTLRTQDRRIVSFRPIVAEEGEGARLVLYRAIPLGEVDASVRQFLLITGATGFVIVSIVLWIAMGAARQFTKPIYALREAARNLKSGGEVGSLPIETNDEFEDLSRDFSEMARTLSEHRRNLQQMVEERTHELEAARAELSEIVTYSADAIIGLDTDARVRLWNRGAQRLFGYYQEEVLGRGIDELIGSPETDSVQESSSIQRMMARSGAVENLQTLRKPKVGPSFPVSLTQTLICDEDCNALGSSLIIRDNTLQKKLEQQMRQSERLAAVSIMAAGLAHELNNPLAVLANRIEIMQERSGGQPSTEQLAEDLGVLDRHVDRLRTVTADLLAFAKEADDEPERLDIGELVAGVVRLLEHTFVMKDVRVELAREEGAAAALGNQSAVQTVFVNLLLNAAQATPPGGCVEVGVIPHTLGGHVTVVITDTGPGVPSELRSRIFEPFFTTKGDRGGTGLGLTVCRTIIERQGGEIQLCADWTGGSRFVVTLPAASQVR